MAQTKTYRSFMWLGALLGFLFGLLILGITSFAYVLGFIAVESGIPPSAGNMDVLILILVAVPVLPSWFLVAGLAGLLQARVIGDAFARNIETDGLEVAGHKTMPTVFITALVVALLFLVFPGVASFCFGGYVLTMLAFTVPAAFITTLLLYSLIGLIILYAQQRAAQNNLTVVERT